MKLSAQKLEVHWKPGNQTEKSNVTETLTHVLVQWNQQTEEKKKNV